MKIEDVIIYSSFYMIVLLAGVGICFIFNL
jgi:hypothetical protein